MAPLIYIPITDPFAVFGIILLFALIVVATILLIFTARQSAQDARKAVHDQARYQRLLQLHRKEEQRSLKKMEEGESRMDDGPRITITAPSASSTVRSTAVRDGPSSKAAKRRDELRTEIGQQPDELKMSTASTSLLGASGKPTQAKRHVERLPRALRIGKQSSKFRGRSEYQQVGKVDPEDSENGASPLMKDA